MRFHDLRPAWRRRVSVRLDRPVEAAEFIVAVDSTRRLRIRAPGANSSAWLPSPLQPHQPASHRPRDARRFTCYSSADAAILSAHGLVSAGADRRSGVGQLGVRKRSFPRHPSPLGGQPRQRVHNPCAKSMSHHKRCHRVLRHCAACDPHRTRRATAASADRVTRWATPASPPPNSTSTSRSTRSSPPVAIACSPTKPAAPPARWPPAPSWTASSTSSAPRHPGGLEARPARPLAAPPGRHHHRARRPGSRVPQPAGGDRHHHRRRQARVPHLRRARRVRARPDP